MIVRFLMSNNRPSSMTRIVADTANFFVRQGVQTIIHYPTVDWWDYRVFTLSRLPLRKRTVHWARIIVDLLVGAIARRTWCGLRLHQVDPRVRTARFWAAPSAADWNEGDVAVVHPPYLVPHLLKTLPNDKIKLVTALHVNLESALRSTSAETVAWYTHWVAFHRLLSVPTLITSREAEEGARRLGIRVDKLIYGGIDLDFFRPQEAPRPEQPLTVTLYCDPNLQKGRDAGVEALRLVKKRFPEIRIGSLGIVTPEQARHFDRNYGYLHREEYARALRESDIFLYPSLYDGFPAPPLQAMASGAALVTTEVEGVGSYAEDGVNCLLCRPGDIDGMAGQVTRLIQDTALRETLRRNAPQAAERFSIERSAADLLEFLEDPILEGVET